MLFIRCTPRGAGATRRPDQPNSEYARQSMNMDIPGARGGDRDIVGFYARRHPLGNSRERFATSGASLTSASAPVSRIEDHRPDFVQRMLVGRSSPPLLVGNVRLEAVVVGFLGQSRQHQHPGGLGNEQPEGVIRPGRLQNFALAEKLGELLLQCFEMASCSSPGHDAVGQRQAPVPLAAADGDQRPRKSAVTQGCKSPHG